MTRPLDRYYIVEAWGFSTGHAARTVSYSILDRCYAHREVWIDYAGDTTRGNMTRLARAARVKAECARRNADEREWERQAA